MPFVLRQLLIYRSKVTLLWFPSLHFIFIKYNPDESSLWGKKLVITNLLVEKEMATHSSILAWEIP